MPSLQVNKAVAHFCFDGLHRL